MTIIPINEKNLLPAIYRTHPSIVMHDGERFMSYRIEEEPNVGTWTGICRCGVDWQPTSRSVYLSVMMPKNADGERIAEDCRLFSAPDGLRFVVTNRSNQWTGKLETCYPELPVTDFKLVNPKAVKNWTPNAIGDWLPWPTKQRCNETWEYGEPRGGTPLIHYGGHYDSYQIGFFHSHITADSKPPPVHHPSPIATNGAPRRTYFGSPYAITKSGEILFPRRPLIWPRMYSRQDRAPNNHDVVFPCGIALEGERWTVSYGDDKNCWLAEFTTTEIFEVLEIL